MPSINIPASVIEKTITASGFNVLDVRANSGPFLAFVKAKAVSAAEPGEPHSDIDAIIARLQTMIQNLPGGRDMRSKMDQLERRP